MSDFWKNVADSGLCENGEKSKVYKFFYELFSSEKLDFRAGVITDERIMVRNVKEHFKIECHDDTIKRIYEELGIGGDDERNIHLFCYDDGECFIIIDYGNNPGFGQISFMADILDAYKDYKKNTESPEIHKLDFEGGDRNSSYLYDTSKMKNYLKEALDTRFKPVMQKDLKSTELGEGEFYIAHSEAFKEKDLLFNLNLENIETLGDLFQGNMCMSTYAESPYYHDAVIRFIPDYEIIEKFKKEIVPWISPENLRDVEVTLANVRQVLLENLDLIIFRGYPLSTLPLTFRRAVLILYGQGHNNDVIPSDVMEDIEQRFPNFRFVNEFVESSLIKDKYDIYLGNKEDVAQIPSWTGYTEMAKEIINLLYKEKRAEIQSLRNRPSSNLPAQMAMSFVSSKIDGRSEEITPKTIEDLERELKELEATGLITKEDWESNYDDEVPQ